jgi:hypothetical protein
MTKEEMYSLKLSGMTLLEIGKLAHLSDERVRQILVTNFPPTLAGRRPDRKRTRKNCDLCNNEFYCIPSRINVSRFCSQYCRGHFGKKKILTKEEYRKYSTEKTKQYRATEKGSKKVQEIVRKQNIKYAHKQKARMLLNCAVKSGKVKKSESCQSCKKIGKVHGHHENYDKPLEAIWLCPLCHKSLHASRKVL